MKKIKLIACLMISSTLIFSCKKNSGINDQEDFTNKNVAAKKARKVFASNTCGAYFDSTDTTGRTPNYYDEYAQCRTIRPKWWPNLLFEIPSNEIELTPYYEYSLARDIDDFVVGNIIRSYLYSNDETIPFSLGNGRAISADEQDFLDRYFEERIAKILTLKAQYPTNSVVDESDNSLMELYSLFESNSHTNTANYPSNFFGSNYNAQQTFGPLTISTFSSAIIVDGVRGNIDNRPSNLYWNLNLNRYYYYLFISPSHLAQAMTLTNTLGPVDVP